MNRNIAAGDNDQELIRQVSAGSEDALRRLVDVYGQRMYAYALRITGEPASADEAVQESLLVIWQRADRFRGEGRAIAWLLGIVHHKALNQLRGRVTESLDDDLSDPAAGDPLPGDLAEARERRRLVRAGMGALSVEHRTALELIFYQGLSLNEAADVCGCPVGTIKSRLNYAKASLRGTLSRSGIGAEDGNA